MFGYTLFCYLVRNDHKPGPHSLKVSKMQQTQIAIGNEIRITRGELLTVLAGKHEFLWHFAKKMAECRRCSCREVGEGSYRVYINGYGDFMLYHRCGDCDYPVRSYVDLSQDINLRCRVRRLWLSKYN